jgi:hypothetical protein
MKFPILKCISGASLLFSLIIPAARAQLQFSNPVSYPVGNSPGEVVVGDFNGDGKLDMAVLNTGDQTISILLGNGDGTFQAATNQPTGTATALAAGDFNGDGKLDLALANGSANTVSVMLGNGDGTFQAPVQYNIGSSADFVAVADFNNDKKMDLLVSTAGHSPGSSATPSPGELTVLLGKGDGTFQAPVVTHLDSFGDTTADAAISDFNSDGKLDVVIGNLVRLSCLVGGNCVGGNVLVFLGNGDGTFQAPAESTVDFYPGYFVTGDFDGNGKIDLAVIGGRGFRSQPGLPGVQQQVIATLLGKGDGTFGTTIVVASLPGSVPLCKGPALGGDILATDLNGDDKPDLIMTVTERMGACGSTTPSPAVWAFLGNGDGTFQAPQKISLATLPSWLTLGDFQGDKLEGFAVSNSSANNVSVFLNGTAGVTLSLTLAGSGAGTVTSHSDILNCSSFCSGQFAPGAMVTLTAAPNAASNFTGWSGACSGTGTCGVTMTSNESVTATFGVLPPPDFSITPVPASLTGQRGGQASDVITLAPLNGEPFGSPIQLSCKVTGSTPLATCDFSSASATPGAKSATSTLMITVPTQSARLLQKSEGKLEGALYAVFLPLPVIPFIGLGLTRGKRMEGRRGLWLMCSLLIAFAAVQIGCGTGSRTPPPLNYTVTVTATSGAIEHTTQVSVTVP